MPNPRAALLLVVFVAAAGCPAPPPDDGNGGDGGDPTLAFDGEQALSFAEAQMRWPNGSTRYRIPDTPGNDAVARMLQENWTELGWNASLDRFQGSDFFDADKHPTIQGNVDRRCSDDQIADASSTGFHNVEASIGDGPEVLVTAHYDTKEEANQDPENPDAPVPGADDGASGVAAMWELARVLPGRVDNVTVTLVAFDAEDGWDGANCWPSAGSTVYADTMPAARRANVSAVVNLDMVGNADAAYPREGYSRQQAPDLLDAVWSTAHGQDASAFEDRHAGPIGDDHIPFQHAGMPAIDVIHYTDAGFPSYWHTTRDTLDKLDASMLEQVGRVVEAFVLDADRGGWRSAT